MNLPPSSAVRLLRWIARLLILLVAMPAGRGQDSPVEGQTMPSDRRNLPQAWIDAGQVVSQDDPAWEQLRAELDKDFARSLAAGVAALTNDLAGARREFAIAAGVAEGSGARERGQAQQGLEYVDALLTLRQATTIDAFTSGWVRVRETEAALPYSWPRVGTNLAVQVVEARARAAMEQVRRAEAVSPLDADLAGLEVAVGLRKPHRDLLDPVTGHPAAPLESGADVQWYFNTLERLQGDYELAGSLTPERRRALQSVERRLQIFPGAY